MSRINERAMLCGVFTSLPGIVKKDAEQTSKVLSDNHASQEAGYWSGRIYPKAAIHPCQADGAKLRSEIDLITGPHWVKGLRILPSGLYFDAMEKGRNMIQQFNMHRSESSSRLQEWKDTMKREQNGLFRPDLYPDTPEQFAAMFRLDLKVMPIPDGDSFLLLQLADEAIAESQKEYESQMQEQLHIMEQELFTKLMDPILNAVKIVERLENGEKPKVYQSLLGNIDRMVKVLPHLNLNNNPQLEELRLLAKGMVNQADVDSLKESSAVRKATLDQANAILAKMKGYSCK